MFVGNLLHGRGDSETGTTAELIALSKKFEDEHLSFVQPPKSCISCSSEPGGDLMTADWVPGHRPGWWICKQCETVLPHRCYAPDFRGRCCTCGCKVPRSTVLHYLLDYLKGECNAAIWESERMFRSSPSQALLGNQGMEDIY